jgi:hypothetical protein
MECKLQQISTKVLKIASGKDRYCGGFLFVMACLIINSREQFDKPNNDCISIKAKLVKTSDAKLQGLPCVSTMPASYRRIREQMNT